MPVPDCECIWGLPLNDKLDAIYCVYYQNAQSTVDLPTCECVKGMPLQDKVSAIFCALLQQGGGGGGNIDPDQINGITPFGISVITATPPSNEIIMTDAAGLMTSDPQGLLQINFAQIQDASMFLSAIQNASDPSANAIFSWESGPNAIAFLQPAATGQFIANNNAPFSGTVNPTTETTSINGIVTNLT